ncbi:hypothetical protein ACLKA6_008965 [Drosophila palustris]
MDLLNLKAAPVGDATATRTRTERSSRTSGPARTSTTYVTTSYGYTSAHINITSGQIDWDDDDDPGEDGFDCTLYHVVEQVINAVYLFRITKCGYHVRSTVSDKYRAVLLKVASKAC